MFVSFYMPQVLSKFKIIIAKFADFLGEAAAEQLATVVKLQDSIVSCRTVKLEYNCGRTLSKTMEAIRSSASRSALPDSPGPIPQALRGRSPKNHSGWLESGPLAPEGAWISTGCPDDLVPKLAGRGGDHFGISSDAQMVEPNSEFCLSPPTSLRVY